MYLIELALVLWKGYLFEMMKRGKYIISKARLMIKILIVAKIEDREIMERHKRPPTSLLMLTYGN